jgi:hypothetical protein
LKDVFDYCKTNQLLDNLGFKKSSDLASKMETWKGLARFKHHISRSMCFKGIKFSQEGDVLAIATAALAAAAPRAPMFLAPSLPSPEENMLDDVYDI